MLADLAYSNTDTSIVGSFRVCRISPRNLVFGGRCQARICLSADLGCMAVINNCELAGKKLVEACHHFEDYMATVSCALGHTQRVVNVYPPDAIIWDAAYCLTMGLDSKGYQMLDAACCLTMGFDRTRFPNPLPRCSCCVCAISLSGLLFLVIRRQQCSYS